MGVAEKMVSGSPLEGTRNVWLAAVAGIVGLYVLRFFYKLIRTRMYMRRLEREGLPMPPHHWLFGHILLAAKVVNGLPPHAHLVLIADQVRQLYPHLDTAFYLDTWPFSPPTLVVLSPDLSVQFTQDANLPKFEGVRQFLKPLTGKKDLVTMEGQDWKHWRMKFNPGFSVGNITSMIPKMMHDVRIYRDKIMKHATVGDLFQLELTTLDLSMDVIGRVVLDHSFNSQKQYNPLCAALIDQLFWCSPGLHANPLQYFNFFRWGFQQYNSWRMNSYCDPLLKQKYETIHERPKSKVIADLIMSAYVKENSADGRPTKMDPEFAEFMRAQVKLFLQAGHDTTAVSVVYNLYMLQKHPDVLRRLRAELDEVFGPDRSATCDRLEKEPNLLGKCQLLQAVMKETLRLFPPSATARFGLPDFFLTDHDGTRLPTEGCLVVGNHHALHHNPRFWPRAEEFLPERWLVSEGHPLYPVRNGWRPFERGPRNCLGQELATTEIRLVVAVICREFDFKDAYAEYDLEKMQAGKNLHVNGERAYQVIRGSGHPSNHFPCRVSFAKPDPKE